MSLITDSTINKGDNMAKGITLEELDRNIKPNVIPLKNRKKLDRKPKKPQKPKPKRDNNRDILYDDLFDQYRYNNNPQVNYQNNYQINNNGYANYNHRRRNRWDVAGRISSFIVGFMFIFFAIYVVLTIIVGIWEFFLAHEEQICCLLTLFGLLGMANQ
jgi:hypothetical protein